jgi:FKBP-type peptidyl-prolyl cis-trans isomerase FklB
MQLMVEGDKWELYVPAELGYGGRGSPSGSIKPGDALVFTIEIVNSHV